MAMTERMKCPRCGAECDRDEVDIGVGIQGGPWGCPDCHWTEAHDVIIEIEPVGPRPVKENQSGVIVGAGYRRVR